MEESHLGAGALCQICFEPFGRIEDLKAPYVIACGHTFCLGCLNTDDPGCGICGAPFERQAYSKLLQVDLNEYPTKILSNSSQLAQQFQESITRVNDYTDVSQIRRLYEKAHRFLDSQPRHRFKDLATNVCLLGYLLQTKEALKAHNQLANDLTERIHRLRLEQLELQARFDQLDRQKAYDHAFIMRQLPNMMRRNPDVMPFCYFKRSQRLKCSSSQFDLLSDEVLEFRKEINELKSIFHDFRSHYPNLLESLASSRSPSPHVNPTILLHPASRSPSFSPTPNQSLDPTERTESFNPLDLLDGVQQHRLDPDMSKVPSLNTSTASDSLGSPDAPYNCALPESDSDQSDAEGEDHATSHVRLLSKISIDDFRKGMDGSNALLQTGYTPTDTSSAIYQPRAVYPGNTVRFNLGIAEDPFGLESDTDILASTPTTDVDSVMAMSISSLPMLRTPLKERLRFSEQVPPQVNTASLRDGESSASGIDSTLLTTSSIVSKVERLSDILMAVEREGISSTMTANPRQHPRISTTTAKTGAGRTSRVVTRSKSFPNILATRTVRSDISSDTESANSRFMAELRSCLTEVITRVFIQLMANWNGQVLNPSTILSSISLSGINPASNSTSSQPLSSPQRNQTPS